MSNKADELAVYSANISKERHLELAKLDKEVKDENFKDEIKVKFDEYFEFEEDEEDED